MRSSEGAQSQESRDAAYRRRRRILRIIAFTLIALSTITAVNNHRSAAMDSYRFNHHTFLVTGAPAGDTITIRAGDQEETVQLLGVFAPHDDEHHARAARLYTSNRLIGKPIALLLEPPQTRNTAGHLLAYVFPFDVDNLNVDIVKDGMAYADRRTNTMLSPTIAQGETEARKKSRGLWKGLDNAGMPRWRREWLTQQKHRGALIRQ